jgi:hypothetical protein
MARNAPSTWIAVRRILGRLRRCRDLSLYQFPDRTLGWGKGFDAVLRSNANGRAIRAFEAALKVAGECPAVCSAVCEAVEVMVDSHIPRLATVGGNALIVRNASAVQRLLTRRLYARGALAFVFAGFGGAAVVAGARLSLIAPLMLAAAIVAASAWATRRLIARISRLEVLAAIEGPVTLQKSAPERRFVTPAVPDTLA